MYLVQMLQYQSANRSAEAIAVGVSGLAALGLKIPEQPNELHVLGGLIRAKWTMWGRTFDDLAKTSDLSDPVRIGQL
ncbi:hypothetical protein ACSTI9_00270, partial [Vibrio parahaemolyticus]